MKKTRILTVSILTLLTIPLLVLADPLDQCKAYLEEDKLVLENSRITRVYEWNRGQIISRSVTDKFNGKTWRLSHPEPDFTLPGGGEGTANDRLDVEKVDATPLHTAHLRATVYVSVGQLQIKRSFRIYPDCPAIACDIWIRGVTPPAWGRIRLNENVLRDFETNTSYVGEEESWIQEVPIMERLALPGRHWRLTSVEFFDVTDVKNTYTREQSILSYNPYANKLKGNLLFLDNILDGGGFFILKESFPSNVQLAYPGYDFVCSTGNHRVAGIGIEPDEVMLDTWIRAYGFVTGVTSGDRFSKMKAIRAYQDNIYPHRPSRTDMILMNTWGDRSEGKNLNEEHCLAELDACHRLGITHYQLDAGWQKSVDPTSPDFFRPDMDKFPNGLNPLVNRGKELGIEFCLWTDPRRPYTYAQRMDFTDALARLNREYGVRTFKLDGIVIRNKQAEMGLRRILDSIMVLTDHRAIFNLDITAGRRWGYHYFYEYGNLFLENRYTDLSKCYYPHWTLRNVWMLSHYVKPQRLQIEFLNKWRNAGKYPADDPLAPSKVPFEYSFAITMVGQPLVWFEVVNLPEEGFKIAPVVKKYREIMADIHSGQIFPVGEEPQGTSWTGFQSILNEDSGYLLVFREYNDRESAEIRTWLPPDTEVEFTSILGQGEDFRTSTGAEGLVGFQLSRKFTYALYKYQVLNQ